MASSSASGSGLREEDDEDDELGLRDTYAKSTLNRCLSVGRLLEKYDKQEEIYTRLLVYDSPGNLLPWRRGAAASNNRRAFP